MNLASERTEVRRSRERHGVAARKAIQMARYWAEQGNGANAERWAEAATKETAAFAVEIATEARLRSKEAI